MKQLLNVILGLLMISSIPLEAQKLNLPDDAELAAEARRRFALSVDAMSIKDYKGASKALFWMLNNVPDLYDGQYIHAYKAYEELANAASDEAQKNMYLDSMFWSYNKKGEVYELTDREINNKAYRYYKYWKSNKSKMADGMAAYRKAYENPDAVINNNLVSYMDMVRRYKAYGNDMSDSEVLDVYTQVNDVIDAKLAAGGDEARLNRYKDAVSGLLTQIMGDRLNCDFIDQNLAPALDEKADLKLAKKVFGLMLDKQCSSSPYYLKAALIIQDQEPTAGLASVLAKSYAVKKNYESAEKFYLEALEMTEDSEKKGELQMDIAKLLVQQGKKADARTAAFEAAKLNKELEKDAFVFVAAMYMNSFDDCAQRKSQIDDRAIFMAAYDLYQRAGDTAGMAKAKEQFPTISDVFTANKEEGQNIKVGCWIKVTTTIRTRPTE